MQSVRNFLHYLVSILLWILFGYYWYLVSGRRLSLANFLALAVLTVVSLAGLLLTLIWVRHNQNIARRNRRSNRLPEVPETFDRDHIGRPILGPGPERLRGARVVSINLDPDGNKVYAAGGEVST